MRRLLVSLRSRGLPAAAASGIVTAGLVAHYKFDEGSGDTLADSVGIYDGVLGSAVGSDAADPTWAVDAGAPNGQALVFSETGTRVNIGQVIDDLTPATNAFAICIAIKPTGIENAGNAVVGRSTAGTRSGESDWNGSTDVFRAVLGNQTLTIAGTQDAWQLLSYGWNGSDSTAWVSINDGARVEALAAAGSAFGGVDAWLGSNGFGNAIGASMGTGLVYGNDISLATVAQNYQALLT